MFSKDVIQTEGAGGVNQIEASGSNLKEASRTWSIQRRRVISALLLRNSQFWGNLGEFEAGGFSEPQIYQ